MASRPNNANLQSIILGPNGKPASLAVSERDQGVMGAYQSYDAIAFRYAPFSPDIFIAAKGYAALDDMLHIAAVRAPLNILRNAVLAKGWTVEPAVDGKPAQQGTSDASTAGIIADALTAALSDIEDAAGNVQDFRHCLWELLYAVHVGFHITEINWKVMDKGDHAGKLGFASLASKPARQIGFDVDLQTLAPVNITSFTPLTGYNFRVPVEKVIRYTFQPKDNLPYGNGIGRTAYKHSWSIDFLTKFWNIALESFGGPFILAHAPPGKTLELARKVLDQIKQGAPTVLPTGVEAELIEIAGTGIAGYLAAVQHHGEQCALAYLGNTLTSGTATEGTNTNALGQVHQDTQDYGIGAVRTDVENLITAQLFRRFTRYNFGDQALRFTPRLSLGDWDSVDMASTAKAFGSLITAGAVHENEPVVRERMNLPPPEPEFAAVLADRSKRKDEAAQTAIDNPGVPPGTKDKKNGSK